MGVGYSDFGEDMIREGLANRGWYVSPTGKINDNCAPMARTCDDALILPDLQISSCGKTRWAEVKRKKKPGYLRIENKYTHGFCRRQWEHYKRIEKETGLQVWLFIWEEVNRVVCYAPISYLLYPQYRNPKPFKYMTPSANSDFCEHGMAFFQRDDLWKLNKTQFLSGDWVDNWLKDR